MTTVANNEIFLDFDGNVGIPRCNPLEVVIENERTILSFSFGKINLPKLSSILEIPELDNNYAELVSNDGTNIKLTCGEFEAATYNSGDPLPGRFHVKEVTVNGKDKSSEYIDQWYPWVKYDIESIAYQLYYIYQEELGGILRNTQWKVVLP